MSASAKAKLLSTCEKARCMSFNGLTTPIVLIQTRSCFQPYLTLDMLQQLPEKPAFSIPIGDAYNVVEVIQRMGKGIKAFSALQDYYVHIQVRDIDSFGVPKANDTSVNVTTSEGGKDLLQEEYMNDMLFLEPNSFVSFHDEIPLSTGKRRGKQSIDRGISWLRKHLSHPTSIPMIATIEASNNDILLDNEISSIVNEADRISGVNIAGLFLGETTEVRNALLERIYSRIDASHVRFITGPNTPFSILESIAQGSDVFVSSYPILLAEQAYASCYWNGDSRSSLRSMMGWVGIVDATKLNLMDSVYKEDHSPVVEGCDCYCCKHFTKGYIHHLFNCHEMLGIILLAHHNLYHFMTFIRNIRFSIQSDALRQFTDRFNEENKEMWSVCYKQPY